MGTENIKQILIILLNKKFLLHGTRKFLLKLKDAQVQEPKSTYSTHMEQSEKSLVDESQDWCYAQSRGSGTQHKKGLIFKTEQVLRNMWIRVYFKVNSVVVVEKQPKSGPADCSLLGMNKAALTDSNMCSGALLTHLPALFSKSDFHEVSAESNRTLSSLKKSQAAGSRRIISGTIQRAKSLRDDWLEMGSHLITYFRF